MRVLGICLLLATLAAPAYAGPLEFSHGPLTCTAQDPNITAGHFSGCNSGSYHGVEEAYACKVTIVRKNTWIQHYVGTMRVMKEPVAYPTENLYQEVSLEYDGFVCVYALPEAVPVASCILTYGAGSCHFVQDTLEGMESMRADFMIRRYRTRMPDNFLLPGP